LQYNDILKDTFTETKDVTLFRESIWESQRRENFHEDKLLTAPDITYIYKQAFLS
jgi:hypothetical protein